MLSKALRNARPCPAEGAKLQYDGDLEIDLLSK